MCWILDLDILLLDVRYCKKTWSHAKTIFWGVLNIPPPPQKKKSIFFQRTQNFLRKRVGASQIGDYNKIFLIMQNYLGGQH
jgi:hypothetical protein